MGFFDHEYALGALQKILHSTVLMNLRQNQKANPCKDLLFRLKKYFSQQFGWIFTIFMTPRMYDLCGFAGGFFFFHVEALYITSRRRYAFY